MDDHADKCEDSQQDCRRYDPRGYRQTTWTRHVLTAVIAIIALGAAAASIPYWDGPTFPVTSLVIYVAGMVFVAMPLCLLYEALLKSHHAHVERAKLLTG
ncbi:hypothetical protein GCM10023165_54890 [Variovorax defluvii]|uniref:Uncharacterized protein n=1 Tax=Variovorax defluvii TaxID=913761 RepID=A0ABP8IHS5_9BURK